MTKSRSRSVTIRDVAERAGVSVATVSRFLNRKGPISVEVAERLERVMAELRYIPHSTARRLTTNKTDTIGLLLTRFSGDFFAPLLGGIEAVTRQNGFGLLVATSHQLIFAGHELPLGPHNVDGLLVFANSIPEAQLRQLSESGFPMVMVYSSAPEGTNIACVAIENKAATRAIVEHLITVHRRRRIVFMRGQVGQEDSFWREAGYEQALLRNGIPYDPALLIRGDFKQDVAEAALCDLFESGVEFDGVFAGNDEAAVGVLAALQRVGKRVPEDVSVVGFDDHRISAYLSPPLTTVRAPTGEVGQVAAQMLIQRLRTGRTERLTLLPTELVIRRSCGCDG